MNPLYETSFTVLPAHTNSGGEILFGGKLLAEMDLCAAASARRLLYETSVKNFYTRAVTSVNFAGKAYRGDLVHLKGRLHKLGNTSIHIWIDASRENKKGEFHHVGDGIFVLVTVDENDKPMPHGVQEGV